MQMGQLRRTEHVPVRGHDMYIHIYLQCSICISLCESLLLNLKYIRNKVKSIIVSESSSLITGNKLQLIKSNINKSNINSNKNIITTIFFLAPYTNSDMKGLLLGVCHFILIPANK